MRNDRPVIAFDSRRFGRAPARALAAPQAPQARLSDDVRLFLATFASGFLFVSILIA